MGCIGLTLYCGSNRRGIPRWTPDDLAPRRLTTHAPCERRRDQHNARSALRVAWYLRLRLFLHDLDRTDYHALQRRGNQLPNISNYGATLNPAISLAVMLNAPIQSDVTGG